jgi:hypothetical protein
LTIDTGSGNPIIQGEDAGANLTLRAHPTATASLVFEGSSGQFIDITATTTSVIGTLRTDTIQALTGPLTVLASEDTPLLKFADEIPATFGSGFPAILGSPNIFASAGTGGEVAITNEDWSAWISLPNLDGDGPMVGDYASIGYGNTQIQIRSQQPATTGGVRIDLLRTTAVKLLDQSETFILRNQNNFNQFDITRNQFPNGFTGVTRCDAFQIRDGRRVLNSNGGTNSGTSVSNGDGTSSFTDPDANFQINFGIGVGSATIVAVYTSNQPAGPMMCQRVSSTELLLQGDWDDNDISYRVISEPFLEENVGGTIRAYMNTAGNQGTGEDNLFSETLPHDTFGDLNQFNPQTRKTLCIHAFGTAANNANTKRVRLYFGSVVILDVNLTVSVDGKWSIDAVIMDQGEADLQTAEARLWDTGATMPSMDITSPNQDTSLPIIVKLTAEATATNDIILRGYTMDITH